MSLSGNLGFVSIDEVLRLLTRSHQQGSVAVTGMGLHGRVFVGKGGIDLATTSDNDELHRHLVNSGYADERSLDRIATGETTLAAIAESNAAIVGLIREMTVESLYHIARRGEEFAVHEGAVSPYASPKSFELEALLRDADERRKDWDKVSNVIPDLRGAIQLCRDLGDREEITVRSDDWKVLSEIKGGSSVVEIADSLGTTEFWTARVAARLVEDELITLIGDEARSDETVDEPVQPSDEERPAVEYAFAETEPAAEEPYHSYEPADGDTDDDQALLSDGEEETEGPTYDQSWWREPKDEAPADEDHNESPTPEVVAEGLSEMPSIGGHQDDEVEEDTEAFLEKVFSELDSSEPESDEGHGLLRRRRMGTLRDFSSDS